MTAIDMEKEICYSMLSDVVIEINLLKKQYPRYVEYLDNVIDAVNQISNRDNPDCIKFGLVQVAVDLTISITGCTVRGCPGQEHKALQRSLEIIWSARQNVIDSFTEAASMIGSESA